MPTTAVTIDMHSKFDDTKWHVESYPSGTVVVVPTVTDELPASEVVKLSHFYVYGPKYEDETEQDRRRYAIANELAEFLNNHNNTVPGWLDIRTARYDGDAYELAWDNGISVACVDNTCGKDAAWEMFSWFIEHLQACNGAQQLMESEDKLFIEHAKSLASRYDPFRRLDIEGLERFRAALSNLPSLPPLGPSEVTDEMWSGDEVCRDLASGLVKHMNDVSKKIDDRKFNARVTEAIGKLRQSAPQRFLLDSYPGYMMALDDLENMLAQEDGL